MDEDKHLNQSLS